MLSRGHAVSVSFKKGPKTVVERADLTLRGRLLETREGAVMLRFQSRQLKSLIG